MTELRPSDLIHDSFALAAERCDDLTPLVYRRLFAERPEMRSQFRQEANDLVKGEMLAQAINVILDFIGDRTYSARMIQCEVLSHEAYGTPPEVFGIFFRVIAETLREVLGDAWSADMDSAWRSLLVELDHFVTHPEQRGQRVT